MKKVAKRHRSGRSTTRDEWLRSKFPLFLVNSLFALLKKHNPSLHDRIVHWLDTVVAQFQTVASQMGEEEARRTMEKVLVNPILLDRRKNKKHRKDTRILGEYNLIRHTINSLPKDSHRSRSDLIRGALRREFPEVDAQDFAPAPSASETAYWILARRYTKVNIASLATRLNRARERTKIELEKNYESLGLKRPTRYHATPRADEYLVLAIEYLKRAFPSASKEQKRRIPKAVHIIKTGYFEVYGKKLEKL